MRQIDTMNEWAEGTLQKYGGKLQRIRRFEEEFGVVALKPSYLLIPPDTPAIPLIWAQLLYSVQKGKKEGSQINFDTARSLRSAASFFYQWNMQTAFPGQAMRDQRRNLIVPYALPTDEMVYTLQNGGMARRMGREPQQSWALQFRHIRFINNMLEQMWQGTRDPQVRQEIAAAGTANLNLWFGMFRGGENFAIRRQDVEVVRPLDGPTVGLPSGVGYVGIRLSEETKSSPHRVADVVISYISWSGLSLGKWMDRLLSFPSADGVHLFSTPQKDLWDSGYLRRVYIWPLLELMRLQGEPSLKAFTDEEGSRIRDKVYSGHSWRRGFSSFCRKKRPENKRAATKEELDLQGRWKPEQRRGGSMQNLYNTDLDLEARLAITALCG